MRLCPREKDPTANSVDERKETEMVASDTSEECGPTQEEIETAHRTAFALVQQVWQNEKYPHAVLSLMFCTVAEDLLTTGWRVDELKAQVDLAASCAAKNRKKGRG